MSTKGKDAEIFNLGAILLNIPGQEYVIGRKNTPGNPGEHFILCPFPNVEIRHCKISVDDEGEFWIEGLSSAAKTSINREPLPLQGKKKLNFGDKISLQGTETTAFVYFEFEERQNKDKKRITPFPDEATDVGNNHVLVKIILEHFSTKELKDYRFVSSAWNSSASQLLRKRCAISIPASKPHEQTKLFRCSEEMKNFASNMRSLSVEIPNFSSDPEVEKFLEDLVKYQLKDSLTYVKVSAWRLPSSSSRTIRLPASDSNFFVILLDKVLQKVSQHCPKLEHLALEVSIEGRRLRLPLPPDSDWSFSPNLKTLEVLDDWTGLKFARRILQKIDTTKIEKFMAREACESSFLGVMHEKNFCNLKEISLTDIWRLDLTALVNLPSNVLLQTLVLYGFDPLESSNLSQGFSDVLEKFKKTLVSLNMTWPKGNVSVVLPKLEKLETLHLFYNEESRVTLPPHFLYSTHFPRLKSLMLNSYKIGTWEDAFYSENTKAEALAQWGLNEGLFNSFITSGQVCSSLVKLYIPHCPPESEEKKKEYADRLRAMRILFPNVKDKWIMGGN